MEDLNKQQLILLTLLVSFMTSVATGIITVALLAEAPPEMPLTVNRVIERTIERVVPDESKNNEPPRIETITKEVTVTVKEDDLLTGAVEKNIGKIAKIYPEGIASSTRALGLGTLLSRDGVLVAYRSDLIVDGAFLEKYVVVFPDGLTSDAEVLGRETYKDVNLEPVAYLKLSDTENLPAPVAISNTVDPKLGQTIAIVGGGEGDEALKASISRVRKETTGTGTSTISIVVSAETNPTPSNLFRGSSVFNLDGHMLGLVVRRGEEGNVVIPIKRIIDVLAEIQKAMVPKEKAETNAVLPNSEGESVSG